MKDTRSRAFAALWGHDLWIYHSKEAFQLGIASFSVPLNVASVKTTGKHSFSLITPYKSFRYQVCEVCPKCVPSVSQVCPKCVPSVCEVCPKCALLSFLAPTHSPRGPAPSRSLSVDSTKDLALWLDILSSTIRSALSCSQVALRLWENPDNKLCGDCGTANPEWASANLLLVICQACAGEPSTSGQQVGC